MTTFISLLRGINVSGQKTIAMDALQQAYEALGLTRVRTYLRSGNVVFDSAASDVARLGEDIEARLEQAFGFRVPVLLRQAADFRRVLASNPFLTGRSEDIARLYVTFLYHTPPATGWRELAVPDAGGDEFAPGEQEIFVFCPNGYGRTRLSNDFFEKKLKVPATTRNWNTVNALYQMAVEG